MKKWIIGIGSLLVIFIACIYIFVPGKLNISQVTPVKCNPNGGYRGLADSSKWKLWWAGQQRGNNFVYDNRTYTAAPPLPHGIDVNIAQDNLNIASRIVVIPTERDSSTIVWQCTYPGSNNPFKRISNYRQALQLKQNFTDILSKLKSYVETPANIYGYDIQQTSTKDTLLVSVRVQIKGQTTMPEVYGAIRQLKDHVQANGAVITGYPMLNVVPDDYFQVALPINKAVPETHGLFLRRMVPGNFMMLEAKGGLQTIDHAMKQLQQYAADHQRTSMAIPFQVMVTDRMKEQDTTKWITRVYYPVM